MPKTITELLIADHDRVKELFDQIENTSDFKGKSALGQLLVSEIESHSEAEEASIYPFAEKLPTMKKEADHAVEDHLKVKKVLATLDTLSPEDDQWDVTIRELKALIEHHVAEEEREFFPRLEKEATKDKLQELAIEAEVSKEAYKKVG